MQPARILFYLLLGSTLGASSQAGAQTIALLLNGHSFDEEKCQQLSQLKTLTLSEIKQDSIGVHISLAHGMTGLGAKGFTSIAAFNAFDLAGWLQAEKGAGTSGNINLDSNGDSFTKAKAKTGSRLIIQVFSYKKKKQKSRVYKVQFCGS